MSTVYSVFQISNYIKNMFRQDYLLSGNVCIQGEVSNCKDHSTGLYFTIKDDKAVLNCIMFRSAANSLAFSLRPGDQIMVTGTIDTYMKNGGYQLYVKKIEKSGSGALYEAFLKLKDRLQKLGMFDNAYKQPIPAYASRIGIVTAPTGAVIRDIETVARRRNPGISLFLYPCLVQGENAAGEIVRGIETLDEMGLDVLIVGRGGGSIEDLWAFNEEAVAHAIFNSKTPVISAVGHETDWTIADFVADLRAPTPSAAAELAVFDATEVLFGLHQRELYLTQAMNNALSLSRRSVKEATSSLKAVSPEAVLKLKREKINAKALLLQSKMEKHFQSSRHRLEVSAGRLDGLSPLKKLSQGYSFASDTKGKGVTSVLNVEPNDEMDVFVKDGRISTVVTATFLNA